MFPKNLQIEKTTKAFWGRPWVNLLDGHSYVYMNGSNRQAPSKTAYVPTSNVCWRDVRTIFTSVTLAESVFGGCNYRQTDNRDPRVNSITLFIIDLYSWFKNFGDFAVWIYRWLSLKRSFHACTTLQKLRQLCLNLYRPNTGYVMTATTRQRVSI